MSQMVYDAATRLPVRAGPTSLTTLQILGNRQSRFTPDWFDLKRREWIPLFVYGNHMSTQPFGAMLDRSKYLGIGMSTVGGFLMFVQDGLIPQPVVRRSATTNMYGSKLKGEVYAVRPELILQIDRQLENGNLFERKSTWVTLKDQTYRTKDGPKNPALECFIYMGGEAWSGRPLKRIIQENVNGERYYFYNPKNVIEYSTYYY